MIVALVLAATLVACYWAAWFTDRGLISDIHSHAYLTFEQSFPLADGWLAMAASIAARQLSGHRPSALIWVVSTGGAAGYLAALDVLYDLEHHVYATGNGGLTKLAINIATIALAIGLIGFAWRFRERLLRPTDAHHQC